MEIELSHSHAAYDWYNDARHDKKFFIEYAAERGVSLLNAENSLRDDWHDLVMSMYDWPTETEFKQEGE